MKEFYTDDEGRIRCTKGNSYPAKPLMHTYENVSKSNDLGNFHHHSKIYKQEIDKAYNKIGSKVYLTNCPVCQDFVYFCKCKNGGSVFFDSLSPQWEKHPCTHLDSINFKHNAHEHLFIYPTSFYNGAFHFNRYTSCLETFKIPSMNNEIFKENLMHNTTLLIFCKGSHIFLTIIISQGKFKNHVLVKEKKFDTKVAVLSFIFYVLKQKDLKSHKNINTKNTNFTLFTKEEIQSKPLGNHKRTKGLDRSKIRIKKVSEK